MSQREAQYRGYTINVEPRGCDWHVSVCPLRQDLPILVHHSFTEAISTWNNAVSEAVREIDRVFSA
jgi:hypothetical protein